MARRKAVEESNDNNDTGTEFDPPKIESETKPATPQRDPELARLNKMLAEAKAKQDMQKAAQDIVYARGMDRDAKEEKIIGLGYSPSHAAEIMMDKDDIDQNGHAVVRPGFTRDQRSAAARNVKHLEGAVAKQEQRGQSQGGSFADREHARREQQQEAERTFG